MFSEITNLVSPLDYDKTRDNNAIIPTTAIALDEIKTWIDQLLDLTSIDYAKDEHLSVIAKLLGYPFTKEDDPDIQRKFLRSAIPFYKSKGTVECFKILFYNLGYQVEVLPLWTANLVTDQTVLPPYLKISAMSALSQGYYDVHVINPDLQLDIFLNGYEAKEI